jgi:hypothetical protein
MLIESTWGRSALVVCRRIGPIVPESAWQGQSLKHCTGTGDPHGVFVAPSPVVVFAVPPPWPHGLTPSGVRTRVNLAPVRNLLPALNEGPMEHFKVGETVARSIYPNGIRGRILRVTDDGLFVTVEWYAWLGLDSRVSTVRPEDLVQVIE